ncbi:MAG: aa3-type cytochrome c oxidase subunit IV [Novosphingobium sp.]|nr:aa3-type cytochrome c oxidase subunit IV [Novosphingobium sp.]
MASGNDMDSATETYGGFTHLIKWGTIGAFLVAAFVVVLISS